MLGWLHAETEDLLPQESEAAQSIKLHHIFGATEDDMSKLRIVSLYEVSPVCSWQQSTLLKFLRGD